MGPSRTDSQHPIAAHPRSARRRRPIGPRALIGATLALAAAVATTTVSLAPAEARSSTTISFVSLTKATTNVPTGEIMADVDHNTAGKVIGSDTLNCRNTGRRTRPRCAVSVDLTDGELFLLVTPAPSGGSGIVVAGTGRYAKATGTVVGKPLSRTRTEVIITLDTPQT